MRAAARIKEARGAVRDEARKAVGYRRSGTPDRRIAGLPREAIAEIWDRLVEARLLTNWPSGTVFAVNLPKSDGSCGRA